MPRLLVFAFLLVLVGCDEPTTTEPDAAVQQTDAAPRVCESLTSQQSFAAPVGECCDETAAPLCAQGYGVCVVDTCEKQCSARPPLCATGQPTWRTKGNDRQCYCD